MKETPSWLIAWRHDGENHWEAISQNKFESFLEKLLDEGVNPATIMISKCLMINWLFPKYHKGCRQVWLGKIYDEINGYGNPSDYFEPDIESRPNKSKDFYGYVSPDGRYFQCEYGGHSSLAREIVGNVQKIDNAQAYLEDNDWLVIYHDPFEKTKYSVGMACGKKISDSQLKMLEALKVVDSCNNISHWL